MRHQALSEFVKVTAEEFGIPGASVGVFAGGREYFASHGVTSVENPLPVDSDTLFLVGSVTKTYTATALMRLVAEGRVELDAPVRRYVPELRLTDERAAAEITVKQLLNHTAGLGWGTLEDSGEGDDAIARDVEHLAGLRMVGAPGERSSYSQAGYNLLGRIIEKVTGLTYERAIAALLFEPLGLDRSLYSRDDVMTRRFSVGHDRDENGGVTISRPWRHWRGDAPGGGLAASAGDLLRWARFHLGDGRGADGRTVVPAELLDLMKRPTAELRGSSLGDAMGLCWFLRDVDGVRTVGHGGSSNGQFAELLTVPERGFAVVVTANAAPDGIPFNQAVVRWALEHFLGVIDRDPEPLPYDPARAREVAGRYENDAMTLTIEDDGASLTLEVLIKPEIRAAAEMDLPADHLPFDLGLLPGDGDEYILTDGAFKGQRGFFTRDASGAVAGVDLAGRLFTRVAPS
ncbi:class A beta-lactamase-related serine hydrolase [Bailinhaonella thermotolerans]|uniref:Class A beta-lactamase-related serine hydrolase n=2 Tax=Bailinhaonella thermotolerans TaxID=1070861 RepID=A0A3A4AXE6_9ACTN|nr:class A beta-lactamase-related serine hydrolase [Bailinhaonella thermotolerans]